MWKRTKTGREAAPGLAMARAGGAVKKGPLSTRARRGLDCAPGLGVVPGHGWAGGWGREGYGKGCGRAMEGPHGAGVWVGTCRGLRRCTGAKKATGWVAFVLRDGG